MPNKNLTNRFVETVKLPLKGRVEYWDSGLPGFGLRISDRGVKSWVFMYRINGRQKRYTIGRYPSTKLADARTEAKEMGALVSKCIDPALEKEKSRTETTFQEMAVRYIETYAKKKKRSWRKDEAMLKTDINPVIGKLVPRDVRQDHIEKIISRLEKRNAPTQANRTFEVVRQIFNWGLGRYVIISPCYGMKKPYPERQRDRNLKYQEIRNIWTLIEEGTTDDKGKSVSMQEQTRIALKLLLLTGQRVGEVTQARKSEIDFEEKVWTIPAKRTKNKRVHRIPLTEKSMELFQRAFKLATDSADQREIEDAFVFPAPFLRATPEKGWKPIGQTSLNHALSRVIAFSEIKNVRPHDFREAVATGMASLGIPEVHIGAVLNHVRGNVTAMHYIRHTYDREKRIALEAWERKLATIIEGRELEENVYLLSGVKSE